MTEILTPSEITELRQDVTDTRLQRVLDSLEWRTQMQSENYVNWRLSQNRIAELEREISELKGAPPQR